MTPARRSTWHRNLALAAFWPLFGGLFLLWLRLFDAPSRAVPMSITLWTFALYVQWGILTPFVVRFAQRNRFSGGRSGVLLARHLLFALGTVALADALLLLRFVLVHRGLSGAGAWLLSQMDNITFINVMVYVGCASLTYAMGTMHRGERQRLANAALEAELLHARLEATTVAFSPDSLLRALDVIRSTVRTSLDATEDAVTELADYLRLTLQRSRRRTAPLTMDIAHLQARAALLRRIGTIEPRIRLPHGTGDELLPPGLVHSIYTLVASIDRDAAIEAAAGDRGDSIRLEISLQSAIPGLAKQVAEEMARRFPESEMSIRSEEDRVTFELARNAAGTLPGRGSEAQEPGIPAAPRFSGTALLVLAGPATGLFFIACTLLNPSWGVDRAPAIADGGRWGLVTVCIPIIILIVGREPRITRAVLATMLSLAVWHTLTSLWLGIATDTLDRPPLEFLTRGWPPESAFELGFVAMLVVLRSMQVARMRWHERQLQELALRRQLDEARLRFLVAQMQPHFLFNALNGVLGLLEEDRDAATAMLQNIRSFLGKAFSDLQPLVALREELDLLRLYVSIEMVRFADRLTVEFDVDPRTLDSRVPPVILQPLVENAIHHGMATGRAHIRIRGQIADHHVLLEISNFGEAAATEESPREGIGLANTRERLRCLFDRRASLDFARTHHGAVVSLAIPSP